MKVGDFRTIPAGSSVWSICNQSDIIVTKDIIIEITHTSTIDDIIIAKPKQVLFNSALIGLGKDEYCLGYSKTKPFKMPDPYPLYIDFKYE